MADEKWNRFASTGSVRDYLEYRACFSCEERERGRVMINREESRPKVETLRASAVL